MSTAAAVLAGTSPTPQDIIAYAAHLERWAYAVPETAAPMEQKSHMASPVSKDAPKDAPAYDGMLVAVGRVDSTKRDLTAFRVGDHWYAIEAGQCPRWKSHVRVKFEEGPKGTRRAVAVEAA